MPALPQTPARGETSAAVDFLVAVATTNSDRRSEQAWALAARQHGVVTRRSLLALGYSGAGIKHRIAKGRLHPVARGVYAVGWPKLTRERRWMVAVLACGEGAMLSHRSAAALLGIGEERRGRIDVSVRRRCEHRRPGVRAMSRPSLTDEDVAEKDGIPVTSPACTLCDLATELPASRLERAINEADKRDLIDPEALRHALGRLSGRPGVRRLRKLLDIHTFRLSDTELERRFRPIALGSGLPLPLTKVMVNGFEVDFYWPDLGLVIETDGLRYHRTPSAQARDRLRDQTHTASGLTPLRFTHYQVRYEPGRVRDVLRRTVRHLRPEREARASFRR